VQWKFLVCIERLNDVNIFFLSSRKKTGKMACFGRLRRQRKLCHDDEGLTNNVHKLMYIMNKRNYFSGFTVSDEMEIRTGNVACDDLPVLAVRQGGSGQ